MGSLFERFLAWIKGLFGKNQVDETEFATDGIITVQEIATQMFDVAHATSMKHFGRATELPGLYYIDISEQDYNAYYARRKESIEQELVDAITDYALRTESQIDLPQVELRVGSRVQSGFARITASFETRGVDVTPRDSGGKGKVEPIDVTPSIPCPQSDLDIGDVTTDEDRTQLRRYARVDSRSLSRYVAEIVMNGGEAFPVRGKRVTIGVIHPGGDADKPDIALPCIKELDHCEQIHGEITREHEGVWSYCAISANGTTVWRDGKATPVSKNSNVNLRSGDKLAFGGTTPVITFLVRQFSSGKWV